jgi:hypothetical protein
MKFIIFLITFSFVSSALAFRGGGGGGGFRGGSIGIGVGGGNVGVGVGVGGVGPRGNVGVGVGVAAGSVTAHRAAAMSVHYPYSYGYLGWYGYAPYHYYYPTTSVTVIEVSETKSAEMGAIAYEIPANCKSETINQINYKHCGMNWFEPAFNGTEIEYKVVEAPIK